MTERLCSWCRAHSSQLDGIRSVAIHNGALRKAIHQLKYEHRTELATTLGQMLFAYWKEANLPGQVVIPVPLHPGRQKARGYNQAALLVTELAERAQMPLNQTDLIRTRATVPQVGLGVDERKANVQGAFAWIGSALKGVSVLLVDDVCTSGATLEACALALRQSCAGSVWGLTLARPL